MIEAGITFKNNDDGQVIIGITFNADEPDMNNPAHVLALKTLNGLHEAKIHHEKNNPEGKKE